MRNEIKRHQSRELGEIKYIVSKFKVYMVS